MSNEATDELDDGVLICRMVVFWFLCIGWMIFDNFTNLLVAPKTTWLGLLFATWAFSMMLTAAYTIMRLVLKRIVALVRG